MNPLVSVVITTYNKADTLPDAIRSVQHQTYAPLEILVVDDGSTDRTAEVVQAFAGRVRYLPQKNGGTGSARNLGIAQARGVYVAFLDGDDLWLPEKLERQMAQFARKPDTLGVQCGAYCVDNRLWLLETRPCRPRQDTLLDFLLFHNLPAFASCLVAQREILLALGGFGTDLVILSDWDMACRLAKAGPLRSVSEPLVLYRHYPNNQSRDVGIHILPGTRSLERFFQSPDVPLEIRKRKNRIWARFYAMLSGGYLRNRQWRESLLWAGRALSASPGVWPYLAGAPFRRLRRRLFSEPSRCFVQELPFTQSVVP